MGSSGVAELVERLSGALHQHDLALDEEQALLEALLKLSVGTSADEEARPNDNEAGPTVGRAPGGDMLLLDEQGWAQLLCYAFERRYGWSESADGSDDRAMDSLDSRAKKKINETLDKLMAWLKEHPLARPIFKAFVVVAPASQKPVVRQRCYLHLLDWIKRQASADGFAESVSDLEDLLQKAIISSLTDVWSATRKACAQRFKAIGQLLTLQHQQGFFRTLLEAWNGSEDAWKAKEGILLGLAAVIAQFTQIDTGTFDPAKHADSGVSMRLRFGSEELDALPSFITENLMPLLFGALAHPQLSVRENAAKAFSSYLSRTPLHETRVCLAEVIRKLRQGGHKEAKGERREGDKGGDERGEKFDGAGEARTILVEAFEAQGLLSLASDLLERLPSRMILQQWDSLIATFSMYLSHSASTVRQACSSLFLKFMAKSDEGAPSLQRLVLQGLSTTWKSPEGDERVNLRERTGSCEWLMLPSPGGNLSEGTGALASAHGASGEEESDATQTWEDREGRLLAYELVLGFLVEDHTLKMFKSDPKMVPGASPCSPKKLSPVDSSYYAHHRPDRNFGERLDHDASSRARSPDAEAGARDGAHQTNLSPYNACWLQSPAGPVSTPRGNSEGGSADRATSDRLRRSSPVRLRKTSPTRGSSPLRRMSPNGRASPTRAAARRSASDSDSVLAKFRHTDDSSAASCSGDGESGQGCGLNVTFEPLRVVLDRMFEEVLYSIGHVRWELRRMGLQVLPLLCTTALWYEMGALEDLWKRWLLTDRSSKRSAGAEPPYAYVGALALKEIVKKILEYADFVRSPAGAGLAPDTLRGVRVACNWLEALLPDLLPAVDALLARQAKMPMRVGAVAVDVLMHVHCRFPHAAAARQKEEVVLITEWLTSLYAAAHAPDSRDASSPPKRMASAPSGSSSSTTVSPITGETAGSKGVSPVVNSSPNDARHRQGRRAAENVERALLADIAPLLPGFVAACNISQMLYITPLLVTTLTNYPEELSIQLQVVEAMHRIIHLPLSCWTDVLTYDEEDEDGGHTSDDDAASCASHQRPPVDLLVTPEKVDGRSSRSAQRECLSPASAGESPGGRDRKRPASLIVVAREAVREQQQQPRKYASCCTPLRGQRRYSYFRPQLIPGDEAAAMLFETATASAPPTAGACSAAHQSTTAGTASAPMAPPPDAAHSRTFEHVCEVIVDGLLRVVELQNTEIALFRAVLAVLYSICCLLGDARLLPRILHSMSVRLRMAENHHSPAGELQRLQLRSNCIKTSEIAEDGSENSFGRVVSSPSLIHSSPSRSASVPSRCSSGNEKYALEPTPQKPKGAASSPGEGAEAAVLPSSSGGNMKLEREQSFGNSLARRTSQALADNVVGLTIDTGTRSSDGSAVPEGGLAPSLHQELNGDRSEAEALAAENEDEEEESDWDESDGWSDEEDLADFEVEVSSFLAAVKHQSRQWTGHVGVPEQRRRVRRLLKIEHEGKYQRSLDDQIREMPVNVRTMVHRLQAE